MTWHGQFQFAAASTNALALTGGFLLGSGIVSVSGDLTWRGGTMGGTGVTNVAGSSSTINAGGGLNRTLNNSGTITNSGSDSFNVVTFGSQAATPGVLNNNGTLNVTAGGDFVRGDANAAHAINNAGTWNVSGANTISNIDNLPFNNTGAVNANSGTLGFNGAFSQTAGSLNLSGGSIATSSGLNIQGGSLRGNGTITGTVSNNATISPGFSAGQIDITSDLFLGNSSNLLFEVGGVTHGTQYDRVAVAGAIRIAGTLQVALIDNFNPAAGDTFDILVGNNITGTFANVALPALSGRRTFTLSYSSQRLHLSVALISSYEQWKSTRFTVAEQADPLISGPLADSDGDGESNMLEYFYGTEPKLTGSRGSVTGAIVAEGNDRFFTI